MFALVPPAPSTASRPAAQATSDQDGPSGARVKSVIDWSQRELIKAVPELKKLVPPKNAEEGNELLPVILARVGAAVKAFFQDFPNTTSVERIRTDRLNSDGSVMSHIDQQFNYLALACSNKNQIGLNEYRTDASGAIAEPGGGLVTKGFASMAIHFHPVYQADSIFRYLGRERVDGRDAYVVAFAQRPGVARVAGQISVPGRSLVVQVQGIAWIDPDSFQIIRLHTDLLPRLENIGLKRQSTEIAYGEVQFTQLHSALWLPAKVTVTLDWRGDVFRNRHQYSNFKLFAVETEQSPKSPRPQDR
ncbi:MAG TPA: hypothetical protein VG204_09055 [Terriglobia bacterium]|nr:hypothetical protein [Terriglobia bacterium]